MRKSVFTFVAVFGISVIQEQTVEELKDQHTVKKILLLQPSTILITNFKPTGCSDLIMPFKLDR
jgi:hypothetical protein